MFFFSTLRLTIFALKESRERRDNSRLYSATRAKETSRGIIFAEVLFVTVAHHPNLQLRSESNTQLPLRLAVCKLHTPKPRLSYPGSRVWDIDLLKVVDKPGYNAFHVEAALLREVFACRVLAYATSQMGYDGIALKRQKRDVDAARKQALQSPEEDATSK